MTVNKLIQMIAERVHILADMPLPELRREHPDSQEAEIPTQHSANEATKGMSRGKMIADIISEDFSYQFDVEID